MRARVYITLKPGLLDAQGKTVKSALDLLGFTGVTEVRVGKYLELELKGGSTASAQRDVERMCQTMLANTVIEQFRVEVEQAPEQRGRGVKEKAHASSR